MAKALTPSSSHNHRHWWPRISSSRVTTPYDSEPHLFSDIPAISTHPNGAFGTPTHFMTSVTNPKSTSSNSFTPSSKSSRFNFAAVIGFGSRSKKQQPVDIQDPPPQVRALPPSKPIPPRDFHIPPQPAPSVNPRLSHAIASPAPGPTTASTDGTLTPSDDPSSSTSRTSYQQSLMTLTDASDPFASGPPPNDRRSSAHSDKSISRRLIQKLDGKAAKTNVRLPMGDGPKAKDSRDRGVTLPSRGRTSSNATDAYQPLRAVEPPWPTHTSAVVHPSTPLSSPNATNLHLMTVRGSLSTHRSSKSSKPGLPWSDVQGREDGVKGLPQAHQRTRSSSSISKDYVPDSSHGHGHKYRPSTSSSIPTSPPPSYTTSPLSPKFIPSSEREPLADVRHPGISLLRTTSTSVQTTSSTVTHLARTGPGPPPTAELPPTPAPSKALDSLSTSHLRPPSSSSVPEPQHPLRARSGTAASTSALSFTSSLSSLSFNSRPSPQDPPPKGAFDYASLLNETLAVPDEDTVGRRGSNSGSSSGSRNSTNIKDPVRNRSARSDHTPKAPYRTFPTSRPLPTPPASSAWPLQTIVVSSKRERTLSVASSTFSLGADGGRTLRKQHSFHNTSIQALAPLHPMLRHHNSFDPSGPSNAGGPMRSPPLPPSSDLPSLPPPLSSPGSRTSTGKDSITSPRRKLFGGHKHDRERERDRERKQELENVDTSAPTSATISGHTPTLHHASSWFDDRGAGSEPASASPTSSSTAHEVAQHIVPPAELLRLGAAWERESDDTTGLRRAKSSWSSRGSDASRTSFASSSSRMPIPRSNSNGTSLAHSTSSKLPRSTSLLSKAISAPSFGRPRESTPDLSFASSSSLSQESYTSLSPPPPRRQQRGLSRPSVPVPSSGLPRPLSSRRTLSNASATSGSIPPKGALIERKPSFLDMSATTQTVTLAVPDLARREEPERDSFLELSSRGMDSIDTIRESIDSVDSFMQ